MVLEDDTRLSVNANDHNHEGLSILNNEGELDTESEFIEAYISSRSSKFTTFLRYMLFLFLCVILPGIPLVVLILFNKKSWISRLKNDPFDENTSKAIFLRLFTYICTISIFIGLFCYIVDIVPGVVHRLTKRINISKVEKTKMRLEFYIALMTPIKVSIAFVIALLMWVIIYQGSDDFTDQNSRVWFVIVFKILLCLTTGTLVFGIEKIILQVIAMKFHRVAYKDRIKDIKNSTKILDALSNAKKTEKKAMKNSIYNSDITQENTLKSEKQMNLHKPQKGSQVSTTISGPNTPGGVVSEKIFNAFSRKLFDGNMWHEETDLNSKYHAKRLAKKLFDALNNQRSYLIVEDFYPYFDTKQLAIDAFSFFDTDGNGDISKREMKEKIMFIYKERRDLSTSLRDISTAVGKLDKILLVFFSFGLALIWAVIFGRDLSATLVPFGTFCVAISFVFGPTAKNLFESIIFVFVVHPYDTGDRIYIGEENYVVERVGLLSTTLTRVDGQIVYYPNSLLMTKSIQNIRRSTFQAEQVDFHVSFDTPKEKIFSLKTRFCNYINTEETREFFPDPLFALADIESCNKLKFFIWLEHKGNWQDGGKRWGRKSRVMIALKEIATSLGITYELPVQKMHTMKNCGSVIPNSEARDYFSNDH